MDPDEFLAGRRVSVAVVGLPDSDAAIRDQLSSLRGLLVLAMLMTGSGDEAQILHLATEAVRSLGGCRAEGVWIDGECRFEHALTGRGLSALASQVRALGPVGGPVHLAGGTWAWGYSMSGRGGASGYLLVSAADEPGQHEQFVLRVLAQQTGVALANARRHARERETAEELRRALLALQRSMDIDQRLTRVVAAGEGQEGIARAVHELTGYPTAIEDDHGNVRAWAGPDPPAGHDKDTPRHRQQLVRRALEAGGPIRDGKRLVALARPRDDILAFLALVDPKGTAGEAARLALEHGATVLTMELARLRSSAETERRLAGDLIDEVVAGADEQRALNRAQALGYDLGRPHRVIVVRGRNRRGDEEEFFHAVRRAARDVGVGSLLASRSKAVVVLADAEVPWEEFRAAVLTELGQGSCRIGVGGKCQELADFPRSHREAQLAVRMQAAAAGRDQATVFEDLGVYQILSDVQNTEPLERLVRRWLGPLLDYDAQKGSSLVATLSQYLEHGGNYDATAAALSVHRNTLKSRLARIRAVSGSDLSDPDARFNLQLATRAWRTRQALRT